MRVRAGGDAGACAGRRDRRQHRDQPDGQRACPREGAARRLGAAVRRLVGRRAAPRPVRPLLPRPACAPTSRPIGRAAIKVLLVVSATPGLGGRPARPRARRPARPAGLRALRRRARAARSPASARSRSGTRRTRARSGRGAPEPAGYAALLRASYPAIKARRPAASTWSPPAWSATTTTSSPTSTPTARRARSTRSACTPTPPACSTSPAEFYREPNGRVGRCSFTGYREVHDVMTANGDGGKGDLDDRDRLEHGLAQAALVP